MEQKQYKILGYTIKDINYVKITLIAAITTIVIFLPFLFFNKGYFFYYGDYNVQQVPFWKLCHEAVRSGNIFWDFNTDLGSPFIGSYSFYVIGSPFFWITLPFPSDWIPALMAPLFVLKFTTAAVLAYAYIKRFVKNRDYAVMGGLLYAFSSFMVHNVFFNHFLDVAAVFPLVLIGLEECMFNKRRGVFALSVALCAVTNYFFFIGQVVFLLLYFVLRCLSPDFRVNLKTFLTLALEAVLGVALASFMLFPSFLSLMGNYRTMDFLMGRDIIFYDRIQRYAHIIQSAFMIPDVPSSANYFPESGSKWASIAAYLPLFGMAGVIAFFKDRKRHWLRRLIILCMVTAFIPFFNSFFFALNWSYYARWFYMPVLAMCLATAMSLDYKKSSLQSGFKWCIGFILMFAMVGLLPISENNQLKFFKINPDPWLILGTIVIALASAVFGYIAVKLYRSNTKLFTRISLCGIIVASLICAYFQLFQGGIDGSPYQELIVEGTQMEEPLRNELPDPKENFYRVDIENYSVNQPMLWKLPTIQTFHSVVSPSILNFYPEVDVTRDVSSRPDLNKYGLRGLLSVKYLFIMVGEEPTTEMPGFELIKTVGSFNIYENKSFVPMGFTFDYYITEDIFNDYAKDERHKLLNKALVLTKEQITEYSGYIQPHPQIADPSYNGFDNMRTTNLHYSFDEEYLQDCANAKKESSYEFVIDRHGFTSKIKMSKPGLIYFSVPYDKGWKATVNGEKAVVEKVDIGFMAIAAPSGDNEIRFDYDPPGLYPGLALGALALLVLLAHIFYPVLSTRKKAY